MGLKLYFNQKAVEALARELRRISWGVSATAAAGGFKLDSTWVWLAGGTAWLGLQATAVVLESIKYERDEK
ncbi:MAG: hypothetical protein PHQ60_01995 [Sideroxydans sp.]|nr:hypothetical protein [Sideroxydans sp.]MDD5056614.1 hypothetical protein [Sideroxydans sp.]